MKIDVKKKWDLSGDGFINVGIFYDGREKADFKEEEIGEALIRQEDIAWYDPPSAVGDIKEYWKISYKEHPEIIEELAILLYYDASKDKITEIDPKDLTKLQRELGENLYLQVMDFSLNDEDEEE